MALPNDPIMLLSVVNLKLRDFYKNLDALLRVRCPAQPVRVIFPEKAFF